MSERLSLIETLVVLLFSVIFQELSIISGQYQLQEEPVTSSATQFTCNSNWSNCSNNCDFGMRNRSTCSADPTELEFESCNAQPCRNEYDNPEFPLIWQKYLACNAVQGFYTNAECFFVVSQVASFSWEETFPLCTAANGSEPAKIFDTAILAKHIWAYLLAKHPDTEIWLPLQQTQNDLDSTQLEWMGTKNLSAANAAISTANLNKTFSTQCWSVTSVKFSNGEQPVFNKHDCKSQAPGIKHALCMFRTFAADYEEHSKLRVDMQDGHAVPVSTHDNVWMCGLECRRYSVCLGFNFQESTGSCQVLPVKLGMPKSVKWGGTTVYLYTEVADSSWNYYSRRY